MMTISFTLGGSNPITAQIDEGALLTSVDKVADELKKSHPGINKPAFFAAVVQLVMAIITSNPAGIAAAIQALIAALAG